MAKKDIVKKKKNEIIKEAKIDEVNSNETKLKIIITVLTLVVVAIGGICWYFNNDKETVSSNDNIKFVEEYEEYNGKETPYGGKYLEIEVPQDNKVKYSSYDEIYSILEDGTGVIYFGFPTCPWCRNLVPVLVDASNEAGIDTIYYFNNKEDRDVKELVDNEIVIKKNGTQNYYKLVDKLESVLGEYEGLNDSSIKRLYYPTVIFVKDGKIVDSHIGTVDSQENPSIFLDKQQYEELKTTLVNKMTKLIVCEGAC